MKVPFGDLGDYEKQIQNFKNCHHSNPLRFSAEFLVEEIQWSEDYE